MHHYRRLIELRHTRRRWWWTGDFALLLPDHPAALGLHPHARGDVTLLVLANLSGEHVSLTRGDLPDLDAGDVLLPTHGPPYGLDLRPWESRIHVLSRT